MTSGLQRPRLLPTLILLAAAVLTTLAVAWGRPLLRLWLPSSSSNGTTVSFAAFPHHSHAINAGWPLTCLAGVQHVELRTAANGSVSLSSHQDWAFEVSKRRSIDTIALVHLPYRPVPLGLVLNTLFFAASWFAVWRSARALRRRHRARRGLCTTCGYDLPAVSNKCPECGNTSSETNVRSRPVSQAIS